MFDIQRDTSPNEETTSVKQCSSFIDIYGEFIHSKSTHIADSVVSGSQSPTSFTTKSSPIGNHSKFLTHINFDNIPICDEFQTYINQIHSKCRRFCKVSLDLSKKIELLNEIYDGEDYNRFKTSNKLIQCSIAVDTPYKLVEKLISNIKNPDIRYEKTIHPVYSEQDLLPDPISQLLNSQESSCELPYTNSNDSQEIPTSIAVTTDHNSNTTSDDSKSTCHNFHQLHHHLTSDNTLDINETINTAYATSNDTQNEYYESPSVAPTTNTSVAITTGNPSESTDVVMTDHYATTSTEITNDDSSGLFLEHDGNQYIRVDDVNYHLISTIMEDGTIFTDTGLQLSLPLGTVIPFLQQPQQEQQQQQNQELISSVPCQSYDSMDVNGTNFSEYQTFDNQSNSYSIPNQPIVDQSHYSTVYPSNISQKQIHHNHTAPPSQQQYWMTQYPDEVGMSNSVISSNERFNGGPMINYNSSSVPTQASMLQQPRVQEYISLPPRPSPDIPFTLSAQLLTPELAVNMTENESELMLTFDNSKKYESQMQPIAYQIYTYSSPTSSSTTCVNSMPAQTGNHRQSKSNLGGKSSSLSAASSTSSSSYSYNNKQDINQDNQSAFVHQQKWNLIGEVAACPLPMFCNIQIPSGNNLRHYFAIRSLDEITRYSDWSNVVEVEVIE